MWPWKIERKCENLWQSARESRTWVQGCRPALRWSARAARGFPHEPQAQRLNARIATLVVPRIIVSQVQKWYTHKLVRGVSSFSLLKSELSTGLAGVTMLCEKHGNWWQLHDSCKAPRRVLCQCIPCQTAINPSLPIHHIPIHQSTSFWKGSRKGLRCCPEDYSFAWARGNSFNLYWSHFGGICELSI
jgi:hypothetical protein